MAPQLFMSSKSLKRIPLYYFIVGLLTFLPLLLALLASAIGNGLGCSINEGGTDGCLRLGIHSGPLLSSLIKFPVHMFLVGISYHPSWSYCIDMAYFCSY